MSVMGIKSRRPAFTFDDSSVKPLSEIREQGKSVTEVLHESPHITRVLTLKAKPEPKAARVGEGETP